MLESIIYPLIIGLVSSVFAIVFEHYVIVPHKDGKRNSDWKFPISAKFLLAQFAGIIAFEIVFRILFPKLELSADVYQKYLSDGNVMFAGVFYICMTSILLTYSSTNRWIVLVGMHLIPYVFCLWWSFTYVQEFQSSYVNIRKMETILPVIHNGLMMWFFFGLYRAFEKPTPFIVMALVVFPINALFTLTLTTTVDAWAGSAMTSAAMVGLVKILESETAYKR